MANILPDLTMITNDIPRTHLEEIGKIIVECSFLQSSLANATATALRLKQSEALLLTRRMNFEDMIAVIRHSLPSEDEREFLDLAALARESNAKRNEVAHGYWWKVISVNGREPLGVSVLEPPQTQSGKVKKPRVMTIAKLREISRKVQSVHVAMTMFLVERQIHLPVLPSPDADDITAQLGDVRYRNQATARKL